MARGLFVSYLPGRSVDIGSSKIAHLAHPFLSKSLDQFVINFVTGLLRFFARADTPLRSLQTDPQCSHFSLFPLPITKRTILPTTLGIGKHVRGTERVAVLVRFITATTQHRIHDGKRLLNLWLVGNEPEMLLALGANVAVGGLGGRH